MANEASPNLFCPNCAYALDGWVEPRLAQARREGYEKGHEDGVEAFRDLAIVDWSARKIYSRETAKIWLIGLIARLLAKGGTDE